LYKPRRGIGGLVDIHTRGAAGHPAGFRRPTVGCATSLALMVSFLREGGETAASLLITNPDDAPPPPGLLDPERGAPHFPPDLDATEPPTLLARLQALGIGNLDRRPPGLLG
jgi:hypothetical protein